MSGDRWQLRGACTEVDPELFFPTGTTPGALLQIEEAKAVCRRCKVRETCLRWALDTHTDAGVWGGLSEDERRTLHRRELRTRRGTDAGLPDDVRSLSGEAFEPVGPVRDIIDTAYSAGMTAVEIASWLGCSDDSVRSIRNGHTLHGVRRETAAAAEKLAEAMRKKTAAAR